MGLNYENTQRCNDEYMNTIMMELSLVIMTFHLTDLVWSRVLRAKE